VTSILSRLRSRGAHSHDAYRWRPATGQIVLGLRRFVGLERAGVFDESTLPELRSDLTERGRPSELLGRGLRGGLPCVEVRVVRGHTHFRRIRPNRTSADRNLGDVVVVERPSRGRPEFRLSRGRTPWTAGSSPIASWPSQVFVNP